MTPLSVLKQIAPKNIILILFLLSFVIVFIVTAFSYSFIALSMQTMHQTIEQRLIEISKRAAALVTVEEMNQYRNINDMFQPSYHALRYKLKQFAEETDVLYVYYVRVENETIQFIVDNNFNEKTNVGLNTTPVPLASRPWLLPVLRGLSVCQGFGSKYSRSWTGGSGLLFPSTGTFGVKTPGSSQLLSTASPVFDRVSPVSIIALIDIDEAVYVQRQHMIDIFNGIQIIALLAILISGYVCLMRFQNEAKKAKEASAAKSDFLSRMSHEIRTPLNAIIGMGELALRSDTAEKMSEYVGEIKGAGQNLLSLINDILDFSKIESKGLEITRAPYEVSSLLNDVISVVRVRITEKPILFTVNADAGLPSRLVGDEARIRQILFNLLSNAAKYTRKGVIGLKIYGEPPPGGGKKSLLLNIEVSDTGIGIKKEDMPTIFGDFVRLDMNQNKSIEGTGLGLAITKSLCQAMDGDIRISSEYGKGSTFGISIPQELEQENPAKLAAVEKPETKPVLLYNHRNVYVKSLTETLQNLNVPVTATTDPKQFLGKLADGSFAYAFTPSQRLEQAKCLIRKKSLKTIPVLLTVLGEAVPPQKDGDIPVLVLSMPAYSVSIANAFNGKSETYHRKNARINFTAPEARLLVVDDIATNLKVCEGLLSPYRAKVDTCLSGAEAITLIKERQYDMVFMDHMMPVMDGIETTAAIRAWEKDQKPPEEQLPVIALTANAVAGVREMFLQNGFSGFLSKPIEIAKLDEILKTWIPANKRIESIPAAVAEQSAADPFTGFSIAGVDLAAGSARYPGAYPEILRSYCKETSALLEKLRAIPGGEFPADRLKEYAVTVHGIKGASYGICAEDMGKLAEFMERTAKAGDARTIQARNSGFIETTEKLIVLLEDLLQKTSPQKELQSADAPDPALLQKLADACARFKTSLMHEALTELEKYEYKTGGDMVQWLREQADNLEYDAISERIAQYLRTS